MSTVCKICGKKAAGRYLCQTHYMQAKRNGTLQQHSIAGLAKRDKPPNETRFKKKYTIAANGCWNWTGYTNPDGYGIFWDRERLTHASRYSYRQFIGPIPEGHYVLHKCDNPSCVNPEHLFTGTQFDNMMDARDKKRMKQYKLSDEDVRYIQQSSKTVRELAIMFGLSKSTVHRVRKKPPR